MNRFVAYNMPKIDLHCHLDGSMSPAVTGRLLKELGEEYEPKELARLLSAPADCGSLAEYLERFDLPIRCLQTEEGLKAAASDLASSAASEHVVYLEVRFAPSFSVLRGLSVQEVIDSVESGLFAAREQTGIRTGIIVCGMRHLDMETNLAMLAAARELYGCGVVACDMAGDERAFPNAGYGEFFAEAKRLGMPFTIHAGECGSRESIRDAVAFGASRIGHGIAMGGDRELIRMCAEQKIGVEMCPTSNLQTKAVRDFSCYPFTEFYEAGVPLSVNTDNRTVSGTCSTDEFMRLSDNGMMNERISERIFRESVEMSFADPDTKHRLLTEYNNLFVI